MSCALAATRPRRKAYPHFRDARVNSSAASAAAQYFRTETERYARLVHKVGVSLD
jgi:hypothetical protein